MLSVAASKIHEVSRTLPQYCSIEDFPALGTISSSLCNSNRQVPKIPL